MVVSNFTENCCSVAMVRGGLLLTYLCNLVDAETNEQVISVPFGLLRDCSNSTGVFDLQSIVENGESCIAIKWSEGLVRCEQEYTTQDEAMYHLLTNFAWHNVDERMVDAAGYRDGTQLGRKAAQPSIG